jgi:hypothetical protein
MSRRVSVAAPATAGGRDAGPANGGGDTYSDKLLKYIPADVVGAWVAVTGLVASAKDVPQTTVLWVAFAVGLGMTAWWTLKQTSVPGRPPATGQTVISTVSFAVWVFALGGPFKDIPGQPLYGSLLLIFYTLVVARITPKEG